MLPSCGPCQTPMGSVLTGLAYGDRLPDGNGIWTIGKHTRVSETARPLQRYSNGAG